MNVDLASATAAADVDGTVSPKAVFDNGFIGMFGSPESMLEAVFTQVRSTVFSDRSQHYLWACLSVFSTFTLVMTVETFRLIFHSGCM